MLTDLKFPGAGELSYTLTYMVGELSGMVSAKMCFYCYLSLVELIFFSTDTKSVVPGRDCILSNVTCRCSALHSK